MTLQFFGRLADHRGRRLELLVPDGTVSLAEVRRLVIAEHRALGEALGASGVRAWVGREPVGGETPIAADANVEFWPPVSGG